MTLAEILLSLLQKYRLSQRKLAEKSGVNYVTINRLLNDYQFKVTSDTIDKLANGIGCTTEERDSLHKAAGSLPEEIRTKFSESEPASKLFRRIAHMDSEEIEELLKELEEKETEAKRKK
jgi:transcriptional regulator with XRE-family HTH domain